jgi:hypothetical protein
MVVFDINGEYGNVLEPHFADGESEVTTVRGPNLDIRIPYYALGRHGLSRLLLPSERTQRPALKFAPGANRL